MTSEELAASEENLYEKVTSVTGDMDAQFFRLKEMAVFDQYDKIHKEYASRSVSDLEALKRALFLQWYAIIEPSCFMGVHNLSQDAQQKVVAELSKLIESEAVDIELRQMLVWYKTNADFYVNPYLKEFPALKKYLSMLEIAIVPAALENGGRGLMGRYWSSLNRGSDVRTKPSSRNE